jgi:hypothetical protein
VYISGSKIEKTAPNFNEKNGTVAITIIKIIILRRKKNLELIPIQLLLVVLS